MDSLITIVAPAAQSQIAGLESVIDALGNPVDQALRAKLTVLDAQGRGIHFMSMHALAGDDGKDGHILFEFTADGDAESALRQVVGAIGTDLAKIFALARDWRGGGDIYHYLWSHRIGVGSGYFANPGLAFAGTPGMSVGRIRQEAALADFVATLIDSGDTDVRPIDRLARIRAALAQSTAFNWVLQPGPPPLRDAGHRGPLALVAALAWPFLKAYLWPVAPVLVAAAVIASLAGLSWHGVLCVAGWTLLVLVLLSALGAGLLYVGLRRQEAADWVQSRAPDTAILDQIGARENHGAQNHMMSITRRKPGLVRAATLRLVFWLIGSLARVQFRPGNLGDISTIHAARWVTIPGTRDLIFLSNYGGSWESYLEDFITRAHAGLTAVWSNTIGFPRTKNLFQDGATDGERFKRYARASMRATRFWYSAYPDLTTDNIRRNAVMRRGLAVALTNDEAQQFLSLFGSAARPDLKLESREIQSLVFGGLGFMPFGTCLLYRLPDAAVEARAFMADINDHIGFGDGRKLRRLAVLTVGLGAGALPKLGLPPECVGGFPPAFLSGISTKTRARILGDVGDDAPERWAWGDQHHDLVLLAYGTTAEAVARLEAVVAGRAESHGMAKPYRIPLAQVKKPVIEPFGFVDGVSQPIIRGSYQSYHNHDPIHLVEPGEFIIGYPDGRGNFPPEPELSALADPRNVLPVAEHSREFGGSIVDAPRALGRNGTFLVVRQLEQDVTGFQAYCKSEAQRLQNRLPVPYEMTPDFIGAKLIGRWQDGGSLVRNQYYPQSQELEEKQRRDARQNVHHSGTRATAAPAAIMTSRPATNPVGNAPIPPSVTQNAKGDNDFLYGVEDPQALRCPFGAHIRRANPRDSLVPGSADQIAISNRHRIYRVGRVYQNPEGKDPGLLFMCLNGDIERQFEFVQQTWLNSPAFHGLAGEQDPLNSRDHGVDKGYLVPSQDGPVRLKPLPQFVKTLGGGYFFMASRSMLAYVSDL